MKNDDEAIPLHGRRQDMEQANSPLQQTAPVLTADYDRSKFGRWTAGWIFMLVATNVFTAFLVTVRAPDSCVTKRPYCKNMDL